jgi:homoserine dehydrogenase
MSVSLDLNKAWKNQRHGDLVVVPPNVAALAASVLVGAVQELRPGGDRSPVDFAWTAGGGVPVFATATDRTAELMLLGQIHGIVQGLRYMGYVGTQDNLVRR